MERDGLPDGAPEGETPGARASRPHRAKRDTKRGEEGSPERRPVHRGWYSRGYHPHFDSEGTVQNIGFRLADSAPRELVRRWRAEMKVGGDLPDLRERIAEYEDAGHGACHLRRPRIARTVETALLHFDGERYRLLEWCIMPNHVHVLIEQAAGFRLSGIVGSWKSFSAKHANRLLGRGGRFWAADYYDRFVRDEEHFNAVRRYIRENPVKAGLCDDAVEWRWSSAARNGRPAPENAGETPAHR